MKRRFYLGFIITLVTLNLSAQKKDLERKDYDIWQNLRSYNISDNGEWVNYTISPVEGNDTLHVISSDKNKEYKLGLCASPVFSDDSKWLAARKGYSEEKTEKMREKKQKIKYKVLLLNLETGSKKIFEDINKFKLSSDNTHLVMSGYKKDKSDNFDLYIYNLKKDRIKNIGNVSEYEINKKGDRLAYIIDAEGKKGNGVELFDLDNYTINIIDNDSSDYKKLSWEKEGKAFAFLKAYSDTLHVEDNHKVFSVSNIYNKIDVDILDPSATDAIPDSMRIRESFTPRFSEDMSILYFGIYDWNTENKKQNNNEKEEEKIPDVDIWHWKDDPVQPEQEKKYQRSEKDFVYLFSWVPDKNKVNRISDEKFREFTITGDGKNVIIRSDLPYRPSFRMNHYDHYLVNGSSGEKNLIIKNFTSLGRPSPGGKYVPYFKDKKWWIYDIEKQENRIIGSSIETPLWNTRDDSPKEIKPPFGTGGWFGDDSHMLIYDEYDIWKVSPGTGSAEKITNGRENELRFRTIRLDRENNYFKTGSDLYLTAMGDKTKESGFYRISAGGKRHRLIFGSKFIYGLKKAKEANMFVYREEEYSDSPDIFVTNSLFRKPVQLSNTNPQQSDYYWGKSEVIKYTNSNGKELQGALYYPANYKEGEKYPMIVYIYEKRSDGVHRYVSPSPRSAYNTTNYSTSGFFVFQPDIIYRTNHPGESAVECVVPAVEEIIETGKIDKEKIALMGHSWGAYQTSFIITQTDLFAAAIAGAPLINMISMYNEIYWNTGSPNQRIFETSQGRLREPWWKLMDEYMANSPMFNADNIKTPLLVTFGNKDGAVDWHQGIEMYTTMRRMQKPYIMLVYEGENHGLRKKENMLDYSMKVKQFIDHYLLDKPAKQWIKEGKSFLEKKEEELMNKKN
ncbi:MAG: prolyl oligopeptidase family serine peptidase [Bacteroidales bacterium]|nr:prolyl oligopeptidase family serine peptidase [Bacteroidales bacterium]